MLEGEVFWLATPIYYSRPVSVGLNLQQPINISILKIWDIMESLMLLPQIFHVSAIAQKLFENGSSLEALLQL